MRSGGSKTLALTGGEEDEIFVRVPYLLLWNCLWGHKPQQMNLAVYN